MTGATAFDPMPSHVKAPHERCKLNPTTHKNYMLDPQQDLQEYLASMFVVSMPRGEGHELKPQAAAKQLLAQDECWL